MQTQVVSIAKPDKLRPAVKPTNLRHLLVPVLLASVLFTEARARGQAATAAPTSAPTTASHRPDEATRLQFLRSSVEDTIKWFEETEKKPDARFEARQFAQYAY